MKRREAGMTGPSFKLAIYKAPKRRPAAVQVEQGCRAGRPAASHRIALRMSLYYMHAHATDEHGIRTHGPALQARGACATTTLSGARPKAVCRLPAQSARSPAGTPTTYSLTERWHRLAAQQGFAR